MIQVIVFAVLALLSLIATARVAVLIIIALKDRAKDARGTNAPARLKRAAAALAALLAASAGFVFFTQSAAATPAIRDANGNIVEGSIAELRRVDLNGTKQWISIRGQDAKNPVLLFLAGGPGGSQMAAVRHDLAELERYFTVVVWDQPGAGKSYWARPISGITAETYIRDGYALTAYLQDAFGQEKICLLGESWGSALGIFLIDRYPEAYHAFVGTGQMVDFLETELIDYQRAMDLARAAGDSKTVATLEKNGPPPYYGAGVTWKIGAYINYLSAHMSADPQIHNAGYNTFRDIFSAEYGLLDKINYVRGIVGTFGGVYQQLYDIDFRKTHARLQVPVYFFQGRHDINAPAELVQAYADALDAPAKELVWFEHSGHNPWINESARFVQELLRRLPR